jgi:Concanavalin A-like lectin/glucanases superfamily
MLPGIAPALMGGGPSGNDAFTKILLHGDGVNGSTVFTDNALGAPAKTWAVANGAHIYNPVAGAFGGAAMGFDGLTWFAYTPNIAALNFAALDWTIDTRVRFSDLKSGAYSCLVTVMDLSAAAHDIFFVLDNYSAPGTPKLAFGWSIDGSSQPMIQANWTPALNTWYHVAAQRLGGTVSLYINGVLLTSGAISGSIRFNAANLCIAASNNGSYNLLSGYLEETRVSIGKARYSGNFSPPTVPYGP